MMSQAKEGTSKLRSIAQRIVAFRGMLIPKSATGRAAIVGAIAGTVLVSGYVISTAYVFGISGVLLGILVGVLAAVPGAIIAALLHGLRMLISGVVINTLGLMAGLAVMLAVFGYPVIFEIIIFLCVVPLLAVLAAAAARVMRREFVTLSLARKTLHLLVLVSLVGAVISGVFWYQAEGTIAHLAEGENPGQQLSMALDLPNPSEPGDYQVETMYYGSGTDIRRPEYGAGVSLVTNPVDVTPFLPELSAFRLGLRERYWGFDLSQSPVNGRVWFPVGEGPFPLVVIVHGNHEMTQFSDPGYAYLGELLASRGYITVSVDQNFLNMSAFGGDLTGESNVGRAWLLLEHLKVWREWQQEASNPFYGKVDMGNISLIGHSRGGEAVAIAAAFNQLPCYPDDANIKFDFGFGIKSVVAIAPSDEFYTPAGRPVTLEDVSYLVLHGAHDGDVAVFMGSRQYQRIKFSGDDYRFKSVAYIYQANHGQFNTAWGRRDLPLPFGKLLNVKPLMSAEEQRQIAKVHISAFLDSTLKEERGYLPLFQNYRTAAAWLPETIMLNRFQDSTFATVSNYEEDLSPASTTVPGGTLQGVNFTEWREGSLALRMEGMQQSNNVALLSWDQDEAPGLPSYNVSLPPGLAADFGLSNRHSLVFSVADLGQGDNPFRNVNVCIETANGEASVSLDEFATIAPPLMIQFTKLGFIERMLVNPVEPVLQTYELPLSAFVKANPAVDLSRLRAIRFVFEQPKGQIALDDIGFRR